MINTNKFSLFVLVSILYLTTLCINADNKILMSMLYVIFVLVGLYDLGKDEVETVEKSKE